MTTRISISVKPRLPNDRRGRVMDLFGRKLKCVLMSRSRRREDLTRFDTRPSFPVVGTTLMTPSERYYVPRADAVHWTPLRPRAASHESGPSDVALDRPGGVPKDLFFHLLPWHCIHNEHLERLGLSNLLHFAVYPSLERDGVAPWTHQGSVIRKATTEGSSSTSAAPPSTASSRPGGICPR